MKVLERLYGSSIFAMVVSIAAFVGCMYIYEPVARIFLSIVYVITGFFALCWFDKFVLRRIDLYDELIVKQNIAIAIVLSAFVWLLGTCFAIFN
jgi:hypothetical protein